MLDILDTMNRWLAEERRVALATVVKTWGSAPRREGSKMGIAGDIGRVDPAPPSMIGSVSGGCVEGAVVEEALAGLQEGKARLLKFGVADDMAWEVGLTCGGSIEVFVEPLDSLWWDALAELALNDNYGVTVTIMDGALIGEKALFDAAGDDAVSDPRHQRRHGKRHEDCRSELAIRAASSAWARRASWLICRWSART